MTREADMAHEALEPYEAEYEEMGYDGIPHRSERSETRSGSAQQSPQTSPDSAIVLLAEDDADMRSLLSAALARQGYEVMEAKDGTELLELVANGYLPQRPGGPDLIISDVRMPGWTGLDILAGLRKQDWAMPVILITAFGDAETHREADRLGAVTMLDKPFDIEDLIKVATKVVPPKI